jgi:pyrrolidone-carboxylate peptidase
MLLAPGSRLGADESAKSKPGLDKDATSRPVILLTGFEPFGKRRPPNPSWEAIKDLDGKEWKGYQLVCKELPVVWEAPLKQLPELFAQYKPVAVFSFGAGGKGAFSLECKAGNQRAKPDKKKRPILDNRGDKAPAPTILKDGPEYFQASIHWANFAFLLAEKGYPIRVSTNAGGYLCDETFYTLEWIRATKHLSTPVLFCHVPPLGSKIGEMEVTATYVHGFVKDVLDTWYTLRQTAEDLRMGKVNGVETTTALRVAVQAEQDRAKERREKQVKDFIGRYFRTWSNQDMQGYDQCFMRDACIQFIDPQGGLHTSGRKDFVASQREYHRKSLVRTVEVPETIDIRFEQELARVVVYWKLTAGQRRERGYDHFTLMNSGGEWKIVNLTFYGIEGGDKKD